MTTQYDVDINLNANAALRDSRQLTQNMNMVDQSAVRLNNSMNKLALAIKSAIGIAAIRSVIEYGDAWTQLSNKLIDVTGSAEGAQEILIDLNNIAIQNGQSVETVVEGYTAIADTMQSLGYSTSQQIDFTESFTAALNASGNTAQQNERIMNAYARAINNGRLQGEEFNTIVEIGGPILRALQREMEGVTGETEVTVERLRELREAGDIGSLQLTNAIIKAKDEMNKYSAAVQLTVDQSLTQLANAFTQQIGLASQNSEALEALADVFSFLAENMDTVFDVAEGLAVLFSGRLAASIGTYTSSVLFGTTANRGLATAVTNSTAELTAQGLVIDRATGKVIYGRRATDSATQAQAMFNATVRNTIGTVNTATAIVDRYGNSMSVYANRTAQAATATTVMGRAAGVATTAGRGLLAALGGIPGILLTIGFGLAIYGDELFGAGKNTDLFKEKQDDLKDKIEETEKAIDRIVSKMALLKAANKDNSSEIAELKAEYDKLTESLKGYNTESDRLSSTDISTQINVQKEILTELEQQIVKAREAYKQAREDFDNNATFAIGPLASGGINPYADLYLQTGAALEQLEVQQERVTRKLEDLESKRQDQVKTTATVSTEQIDKINEKYDQFYNDLVRRTRQAGEQIAQYSNEFVPLPDQSQLTRQLGEISNAYEATMLDIQHDIENQLASLERSYEQQNKTLEEALEKQVKNLAKGSEQRALVEKQYNDQRVKLLHDHQGLINQIEAQGEQARLNAQKIANNKRLNAQSEYNKQVIQLNRDLAAQTKQLQDEQRNAQFEAQKIALGNDPVQQGPGGFRGLISDIGGVFGIGSQARPNEFDVQTQQVGIQEQQDLANSDAQFQQELDKLQQQFEAKRQLHVDNEMVMNELRVAQQEQERLLLETHELEKTNIEEKAAQRREEIARAEREAKINLAESMGNSILSIIKSTGSKGVKSQKAYAIIESGIAITAGIAKALNNPYPANLAFAASVAAQGAQLISKLRSISETNDGGSTPRVNSRLSQPSAQGSQGAGRTILLQNFDPNQLYTGGVIEGLIKEIEQTWRDGGGSGRVVFANENV